MKSVDVVIGAMWGDEGKGRLTDDIASKYGSEACVIRFNGGSQAGHTVVAPDGTRHVFHHFGSGTLAGAATYLSKHFIVNPITFRQEYETLTSLGYEPKIYIDECCPVTTIYDMLINQMTEELRGDTKHGSCGLGINETVVRDGIYPIDVFSLIEETSTLKLLLNKVRFEYLPQRVKELKIKEIPTQFQNMIMNDNMMNRFIDDIKFMIDKCIPCFDEMCILDRYEHLIFEGAQGLLLDEESKFFPHVTRSKTGLDNVIEICKTLDIKDINVHYVSRCYTTKHGAGPFPHELECKPYKNIVDKTNIHNEFQGTLRFSYLNLDLLKEAIEKDLTKQKDCGINIKPDLTITCIDQTVDEPFLYYIKNDELHSCPNSLKFLVHIEEFINLPILVRNDERRM